MADVMSVYLKLNSETLYTCRVTPPGDRHVPVVMGCRAGGLAYLNNGDTIHVESGTHQYPVYIKHPASYYGLIHLSTS
jgi:hypothetical protein